MKAIEMMKNLFCPALIGGLGGLLSLGISASAWGDGCVQNEPGANPVIDVPVAQNCGNISGQTGCTVEFNGKKSGRCLVRDENENGLFFVQADFSNTGGLEWQIVLDPTVSLPAQVNTVLVESVESEGVSNCNYIYSNEAISGSGLGYFESNGSSGNYADVQAISFCTDGETNDAPPPRCEDIGELDGVAIDCTTLPIDPETGRGEERILFSGQSKKPDWGLEACSCNIPLGLQTCEERARIGDDNKCMGDNPLEALPVTITLGNDGTWICRTIDGERQCWKRR